MEETVYISKSGSTYSYKKAGYWQFEVSLEEALNRGFTQCEHKWATKEWRDAHLN